MLTMLAKHVVFSEVSYHIRGHQLFGWSLLLLVFLLPAPCEGSRHGKIDRADS